MRQKSFTENQNKFSRGAVLTNGKTTVIVIDITKAKGAGYLIFDCVDKDTGRRFNSVMLNDYRQIDLLNMGTLDLLYGKRS